MNLTGLFAKVFANVKILEMILTFLCNYINSQVYKLKIAK